MGENALPLRLSGEVGGRQRTYLLAGERFRLGQAADNDVVLPARGVSRHHAVLERRDGAFEITDLESRNGTFVDARRGRQARLAAGAACASARWS